MAPAYYGWTMFLGNRPYPAALAWQKRLVGYRRQGLIRDTILFLSHPEVITVGRDVPADSLDCPAEIEICHITRGGGVTYHGPGQLIVYPIFDLRRRSRDLHKFIRNLEEGIIVAFAGYGLNCGRQPGYSGVWVTDRKIASIGIAVQQWISFHGAAINLTTDLSRFSRIRPCGFPPEVMTSAHKELGLAVTLDEFAGRLTSAYAAIFDTAFSEVAMDEIAEIVDAEESSQAI